MGNSVRLRALALVTVGILGTWSFGGAAAADPTSDHTDQGQHLGQTTDEHQAPGRQKDKTKDRATRNHGRHHGHTHAPGQQAGHGHQGAQGPKSGHGDPAGNNGTVKIAGPGDAVGHPSNNPQPGCTFLVAWFGFDEGADVVSTVTFAPQAPTSDVVLGGTAPAQVFVGGDAAGGGTDLDGRQAYTVTFQGEPHPQQGYHVKLTVATPHSLGNDTKSRVFWVEPCAAPSPSAAGGTAAGVGGVSNGARGVHSSADQGVLGETYTADSADVTTGDTADVAASAAVPTAVDAGDGALPGWARSPLPMTLVSFALVLAGVGIVLRNRSRA
ncbi:hypothetical protein [Nocardioides sp. T2.26MG-1]|uniref:hypothetical protein n=1 Tax=Nocardioides sp. T2.26MG-1 TaxID=3041166 RepID=UPI0024776426|nr:hypothetical protein [Nocardioides sp. T2.26MG-1]CAI9414772.1 hypothetical protein HIDPHFAB_02357 [Nocardioides sp. T2.26MG-1]